MLRVEYRDRRECMNEVLEKISQIGIVPVVVLEDAKDAKPLAEALIKKQSEL